MKGKIFFVILLGLFIGLGSTYFMYDKIINQKETEEILTWDLYKGNIEVLDLFVNSYNPDIDYYGIYKEDEINVSNLSNEDKVIMIYEYLKKNQMLDGVFIKYTLFNDISNLLFNTNITFDKVSVDNNTILKKNSSHNSYEMISYDNKIVNLFKVINKGVKKAYKYGDVIYFDVMVTFANENIIDNVYKYSLSPKFSSILCEGTNCKRKLKNVVYRITFKEVDGKYYFESSTKLGSE